MKTRQAQCFETGPWVLLSHCLEPTAILFFPWRGLGAHTPLVPQEGVLGHSRRNFEDRGSPGESPQGGLQVDLLFLFLIKIYHKKFKALKC